MIWSVSTFSGLCEGNVYIGLCNLLAALRSAQPAVSQVQLSCRLFNWISGGWIRNLASAGVVDGSVWICALWKMKKWLKDEHEWFVIGLKYYNWLERQVSLVGLCSRPAQKILNHGFTSIKISNETFALSLRPARKCLLIILYNFHFQIPFFSDFKPHEQ